MDMLNTSLGALARTIPGATRIFHQYGLDFCCAGKRTLQEAASALSIDPQDVARQLQTQASEPGGHDWTQAEPAELIDHILVRYHAVHREQLPELRRLAQRVEEVHQDSPDCPHGLAALLEDIQHELDSHMRKEEMILFPILRRNAAAPVEGPIMVMRMEHDQHGAELERLDALTHGITLPAGACNTWRALYLGLRTFKEDLMEHIHLENNILFENAERALMSGEVQHG